MKIIDLTQEIYSGMDIYPGDPEVEIEKIENDGWILSSLKLGSHTGTHADAFSHMIEDGRNLSQIGLDRFIGEAMLVRANEEYPRNIGLIFNEFIDIDIYEKLIEANPNFVGGEMSFELEKRLLEEEIITYTGLVNLEQLPMNITFTFIGLPLKIKDGDGSPVRAIAIINEKENSNNRKLEIGDFIVIKSTDQKARILDIKNGFYLVSINHSHEVKTVRDYEVEKIYNA